MVLLEKLTVIDQHNHVLFGLNEHREIGVGDEQSFADPEHGAVHVVGPHDEFRCCFHFLRDPRDDVSFLDDVFLFFR